MYWLMQESGASFYKIIILMHLFILWYSNYESYLKTVYDKVVVH